jgi:hypothetical protein
MNSAFLPESFSSSALSIALNLGVNIATTHSSILEAEKRLRIVSLRHGFAPDEALIIFHRYIVESNICVKEYKENLKFPKHDNHIYAAAARFDCPVLTNDQPLLKGLKAAKLEGFYPLEFIEQFDPRNSSELFGKPVTDEHAAKIIHGIQFKKEAGTIFLRFQPGAWCESKDNVKRTILELDSILKISYDNDVRFWEVLFQSGVKIVQKSIMKNDKIYVILISWNQTIVSFWLSGNNHPSTAELPRHAVWPRKIGGIIFNAQNKREGFIGSLYRLVSDDRLLGRSVRKALLDPDANMTLNPFDNDRLEQSVVDQLSVRYFSSGRILKTVSHSLKPRSP